MLEDTDRAGFARGGLAAMPAFEDAPELYRPAPSPDDPLARQDARRDEDFALRAAGQATALTRLLSSAPPEGEPDGMAARQLARFDEESAALLDGAPSPRAEEAARAAIGRARGRFAGWALPQEAAALTVARERGLFNILESFRQTAQQMPIDADAYYAEGEAALDDAALWLEPKAVGAVRLQWKEKLYGSAIEAWVNVEPESAYEGLKAGAYGDALLPEQRDSFIRKARERAERIALDREEQIDADRRDAGLTWEQDRENFKTDCARRIEAGEASREEVISALQGGRITAADTETLSRKLDEKNISDRQRSEGIRRVMAFIDGELAEKPSKDDISAHYEVVMVPLLQEMSPEERGKTLSTYFENVGELPAAALSSLTGEIDSNDLESLLTHPLFHSILQRISKDLPDQLPRYTRIDPRLLEAARIIAEMTPLGTALSLFDAVDYALQAQRARDRGDTKAAGELQFQAMASAIGAIPILGQIKKTASIAAHLIKAAPELERTIVSLVGEAVARNEHSLESQKILNDLEAKKEASYQKWQDAPPSEKTETWKAFLRDNLNLNVHNGNNFEKVAMPFFQKMGFTVEKGPIYVDNNATSFDFKITSKSGEVAYVEAKASVGGYQKRKQQMGRQTGWTKSERNTKKVWLVLAEAGGTLRVLSPHSGSDWLGGSPPKKPK